MDRRTDKQTYALSQSDRQSASQPASQSVSQSVSQPFSQSVSQSASQPASQSINQSAIIVLSGTNSAFICVKSGALSLSVSCLEGRKFRACDMSDGLETSSCPRIASNSSTERAMDTQCYFQLRSLQLEIGLFRLHDKAMFLSHIQENTPHSIYKYQLVNDYGENG
jgi:hypothetical protein